ncbi:hypothetical protein [Phenylobacterium sp.]
MTPIKAPCRLGGPMALAIPAGRLGALVRILKGDHAVTASR